MESSASLYGACQFTLWPVGCDQFKVGTLSGKLQKLDMRGLQRVVNHGRCQVEPKAEAEIFGRRVNGPHSMTYVVKPQIRQKIHSVAHSDGTPHVISKSR